MKSVRSHGVLYKENMHYENSDMAWYPAWGNQHYEISHVAWYPA